MRHCVIVGLPAVVNVKVGVLSLVKPVGPPVIVTVGATVSSENARLAVPTLPAASIARTSNSWAPSPSAAGVNDALHATQPVPSIAHCTCVGFPAVVNVKVGVASLVGPLGPPVIVTVGAPVSTVNARLALPTLPASSVAT